MNNKINNIIKTIALTGTCELLETQRIVSKDEQGNSCLVLCIKKTSSIVSTFNSMVSSIPASRYIGEWRYEPYLGGTKEQTCSNGKMDLNELQNTWVSLPSLLKELGVNSPMFDSEFPTKELTKTIVKSCKLRVAIGDVNYSDFSLKIQALAYS